MESNELFIKTNDVNSNITEDLFKNYWKQCTDPFDREFYSKEKIISEIKEMFLDFYFNVPFIQNCTSVNRKRAKDLERDKKGRIIVDITQPHILEDMDYFRPTAICFEQNDVPTLLKPNGNPNSPYGKWIAEEARRCREGYVRENDGEWIPGDLYFFWNYSPMMVEEEDEDEGITIRYRRFPSVWEGHYWKAHYIWQARHNSKNSAELASRAKGKTAFAAAMLCRRILLGETSKNTTDVTAVAMASDKKFLTGGDVLLDKFQDTLDFCAESTEFPRGRLKDTENELKWEIGYKRNNGPKDGIQNVVFGITSGNTPKKGRGSRASLYILEEFGSWANLKPVYNGLKPSVKNGKKSYGIIHLQGTAGDSESDFSGAQDLVRNPDGNDLYAVENVYDKVAQGKKRFVYFFPGYINLQGYYDENGNSDVVKALVEIIANRIKVKYNTDNPDTLVRLIAETPIVPEEAMLRVQTNVFPTTEINEQIARLEGDPNSLNDVFVGELVMDANGEVNFKTTNDIPIRFFPHKDNKLKGAVEIFAMPVKAPNETKPLANRYIASCDPVDRDSADSVSLSSTFVFDMFTDRIVAEYTGRKDFADDCYEITRRLCLFYNARCLYENNITGLYGYFAKMNCTYLLADTPDYLKERDIVKVSGIGNMSKGVRTTDPIINHGEQLIRDWLCKEVILNEQTETSEETKRVSNIYFIKNLALLKELSQYNRLNNFDRCVLKGTQISTINGYKNIEDIKIGDIVLTASGNYNKVSSVMCNNFDGNVYNIRINGDFRILTCTDNHPVLVRHQGKINPKTWMKDKFNLSNPEYIRADKINSKSDFMLVPKRKGLNKCKLSNDLLYILGWYISDGNISNGNYVKFFLQEDQYEIGLDLVEILNKYWSKESVTIDEHIDKNGRTVHAYKKNQKVKAKIYHSKTSKVWIVEISSKEAQKFFVKYGGMPNNKDISEEIYNSTGLLPLIKGLFEGDGHYRCDIRSDGYERNNLELNSIYENLVIKIRQILIDMGIWSAMRYVKSRNNGKCQYSINITGDNVLQIILGSKKFKQTNRTNRKWTREPYIQDDNGFWVKAKEFNFVKYAGDTYNIEVENDHSYVANGITTHNCMSLMMLMIFRESMLVMFHGDMKQSAKRNDPNYLGNSKFFQQYDKKFRKN